MENYVKMNKRVKKLWVAALRSGKYKKTQGQLRSGDSFCCLGVLCNIHAQEHPDIAKNQLRTDSYMGSASGLPREVMCWAGLPNELGANVEIFGKNWMLAEHNDTKGTFRSFKQIADAIEEQL